MLARQYYVPPVLLTSTTGTKQQGSITWHAPYYSVVGPGTNVVFITDSPKALAQSGSYLLAPSYPYSCSTYAYDLTGLSFQAAGRPIDPPFPQGIYMEESSSPMAEVGTHYGRAAILPHPTRFVDGFWSVHFPPDGATVMYANSDRFPWEVGYTASSSYDPLATVAVEYFVGQELVMRSPIYYALSDYDVGIPMSGAVQVLADRLIAI